MILHVERLGDFCVFVCGGWWIFSGEVVGFLCVQRLRAFLVKRLNYFFLVERLHDLKEEVV